MLDDLQEPLLPTSLRKRPLWRLTLNYFTLNEDDPEERELTILLIADSFRKAVLKSERIMNKIIADGDDIRNIDVKSLEIEHPEVIT